MYSASFAMAASSLDGDTAAGYTGFQLRLSSNTVILWPDCDPDTLAQQGNLISCTVGPGAEESTYLGAIAQMDFTCSQGGAHLVDLVIGIPSDSHLLDEDGNEVLPAKADSVRINCLLPTPTPLSPADLDSDNDGCTDAKEQGANAARGGLRDHTDFWDFFDTPNPNAMPQRDKFINVADIARVVARLGTSGDPAVGTSARPAIGTNVRPAIGTNEMTEAILSQIRAHEIRAPQIRAPQSELNH